MPETGLMLQVVREKSSEFSTLGSMYINREWFCWTLEDVVRKDKIQDKTAIPVGYYPVIVNHSPKFNKLMPLIQNVPGFDGVRIHYGNTDIDTEGCILVGGTRAKDFIGNSLVTFNKLMDKLMGVDNIYIEIIEL